MTVSDGVAIVALIAIVAMYVGACLYFAAGGV